MPGTASARMAARTSRVAIRGRLLLALLLVASACGVDDVTVCIGTSVYCDYYDDDSHLYAVELAQGFFVMVGEDFTIANSGGGREFLRQNIDCCGALEAIAYGSGKWIPPGSTASCSARRTPPGGSISFSRPPRRSVARRTEPRPSSWSA